MCARHNLSPGGFMKLIVALCLLAGGATGRAQDLKIGWVDLQRAILQTGDGQRAKNTLDTELKRRQATLHQMEKKMHARAREFEQKSALLARDARARQQLEVQNDLRHFQESVAQNQAEMEKRQQELLEPVARKLNQILARLGQRENFTLIVGRPEQLLVYANPALDLTDRIVREYNKS